MESKQLVKDALRAQAQADLDAAREWESDEHAAAELDPDDNHSVDDQSQADEAADMANLAEHAISRDEEALAAIDALDMTPTDVVRDGALVGFGGRHYVVGVAAREVDVDGVTYEGIAPDSPVYDAIAGLGAGASFRVGGTEHRLDTVE